MATEADREREHEEWAQHWAEHIISQLTPAVAPYPDYCVGFRDARPAPRDIPAIREALLSGHIWASWRNDRLSDAMRAMFGPPHAEVQRGR